ncbi:two pore domain potassium channel family protein [Citrobacter koseri]|uniref:potassium channel family protein n=1 Tax=Citrobacter koseri TaxID=545 RepID=UPI0018E0FFA1|nr:potassium channel family protein [Citrobacter koseri]MBI0676618.1 two pore domain potassium channel family protein [Citrobacter koseri]
MLESVFSWKHFSNEKFRMSKKEKRIFNIKTFFKDIADVFNFLCWGFGEKPSRALVISFIVILLYSCVYYLNEKSSTQTLIESLYFSIVSFTTLGFGDITQKTGFLRLFSALESLSGLVLMGLFLAGYASKTKRY